MPVLIITRGLPASGKSTAAKAWVAEDPNTRARVNRDDLRFMAFDAPFLPFVGEEAITSIQRASIKALLASGFDVIADDTNLRPKYVREWAKFAASCGAEFEVREFEIDPEEAIRRDAARERTVGERVIRMMVEKYTHQNGRLLRVGPELLARDAADAPGKPYAPDTSKPRAIIVDLDGTLALMNGRRGPYEIEKCGGDDLNYPVYATVDSMYRNGFMVIYCSGREDRVFEETAEWLKVHGLPPGPLLMRKDGDRRKDSVVKLEIFDREIRDQFNVVAVYDDRRQVVEAWRSIGLTVMQVAPGDF